MNRPRIFLGSSGKQAKLLQAITRGLEDVADVEPWTTTLNPGAEHPRSAHRALPGGRFRRVRVRSGRLDDDGRVPGGPGVAAQDFAVVRFDQGAPDPTFAGDGIATTDFGNSFDRAHALALQDDGAIVVGGESSGGFALARYTLQGTLDSSFSGDGKKTTSFRSCLPDDDFETGVAWDVAVQDDGKIIAVGTGTFAFALARYLSNSPLPFRIS
jgi:uncharacterized delta-60 repeat protein